MLADQRKVAYHEQKQWQNLTFCLQEINKTIEFTATPISLLWHFLLLAVFLCSIVRLLLVLIQICTIILASLFWDCLALPYLPLHSFFCLDGDVTLHHHIASAGLSLFFQLLQYFLQIKLLDNSNL